jgi:hypothetical protein
VEGDKWTEESGKKGNNKTRKVGNGERGQWGKRGIGKEGNGVRGEWGKRRMWEWDGERGE